VYNDTPAVTCGYVPSRDIRRTTLLTIGLHCDTSIKNCTVRYRRGSQCWSVWGYRNTPMPVHDWVQRSCKTHCLVAEFKCCIRYYCATLCVSADFAVARCLSVRPSVRPSVCPSRWWLYPDGWRYRQTFLNPV